MIAPIHAVLLRRPASGQAPSLPRHYPASSVLRASISLTSEESEPGKGSVEPPRIRQLIAYVVARIVSASTCRGSLECLMNVCAREVT